MEKLVKKKKKKPVVYEKPAKRKPIPEGEKIIRLNLKTQVSHRMKRQLVISGVKINQESMIGLKRKGIKNGKNDEG